jgi:hypothetical protein
MMSDVRTWRSTTFVVNFVTLVSSRYVRYVHWVLLINISQLKLHRTQLLQLIAARSVALQNIACSGSWCMCSCVLLTPLSTQLAMLTEIFLGVILGLYDPLWHVEWPTKVHEGSGGVLDGLSAVGGALRGFQRPFSR